MSWATIIPENKALIGIFGEVLPDLSAVDLHEIVAHRDGPRVSLRFDLEAFPERAPDKWVSRRWNRVQVTLMAIGVSSVLLNSWSTTMKGRIEVRLEDQRYNLIFLTDDEPILNLTSDSLILEAVSGYCIDE